MNKMICRYCQKPIATQDDYDATNEGEGDHLCWSDFGAPCMTAEEALDVARAERENDIPAGSLRIVLELSGDHAAAYDGIADELIAEDIVNGTLAKVCEVVKVLRPFANMKAEADR